MNELSLFTGAGGGVLASKLLGFRTIGYVEFEPYCQKVIRENIDAGVFDNAPIFSDVRAFVNPIAGCAELYRGVTDIISGGFPCQPFSVAGKRHGEKDDRNMWPQTLRVIQAVKPTWCFLENVPGLLSSGYFGTVLQGLAESGFAARWCVLGADDVGAPHRRKRLWILAHATERESGQQTEWKGRQDSGRGSENLADPQKTECLRSGNTRSRRDGFADGGWWSTDPADVENSEIPRLEGQDEAGRGFFMPTQSNPWGLESRLGRVVNGMANRTHRLKAIGNGQVPLTAARAFLMLAKMFQEDVK